MSVVTRSNALAALSFVLSGGLIAASLGGWLPARGPWLVLVQAGTFVAGMALAAVAAHALLRPMQRQLSAARRYFDQLCGLSLDDLASEALEAKAPSLPKNHPLRAAVDRVAERLAQVSGELQDLVHARNAAEIRALRANEERDQIKAILSSLDEPVLAIDRFDDVVLANAKAEALLDFHVESTQRRALAELVRCETLVNLLTSTCHRKNLDHSSDEIHVADASGEDACYRVTARKLAAANATGEPTGAVAVLRDIGETKVLQQRNAEFVSSVSHEMKTPLAGIKAYVELLADGEADDEQTREEFLGVIASQADRLQRLVENLLNLARMEAGVVKV
ncbi:MAG TPA: histidine kinase dimerization/phospho-acceptor domain-containing protein, partial [Thermoguttaceae bacterium]|nr:histidine kinase dimerization/phospho-acceptor domain-containing protein [Thermoguttaceae bacterium]